MPGGQTGLDLIGVIRHRFPETLCVLITAYATLDTSIEALKRGAYDLIQKPFRLTEMVAVLNRALDHANLLQKLKAYREELETRILIRTRDLQLAHRRMPSPCATSAFRPWRRPLFHRLWTPCWTAFQPVGPDGLGCYRRGQGRGAVPGGGPGAPALPPRMDRPQPGPLRAPGLWVPRRALPPPREIPGGCISASRAVRFSRKRTLPSCFSPAIWN